MDVCRITANYQFSKVTASIAFAIKFAGVSKDLSALLTRELLREVGHGDLLAGFDVVRGYEGLLLIMTAPHEVRVFGARMVEPRRSRIDGEGKRRLTHRGTVCMEYAKVGKHVVDKLIMQRAEVVPARGRELLDRVAHGGMPADLFSSLLREEDEWLLAHNVGTLWDVVESYEPQSLTRDMLDIIESVRTARVQANVNHFRGTTQQ